MADSILRLRVQSDEHDNKLKRAAESLQRYAEGCRKAGGTLTQLDDGVEQFVKELGKMETVSKTARGSLGEMTKTFTDLKMQYKRLTDEEKASPFGKALNDSLNQLKGRIREAQNDLKSINQELQGGKFGQFGSILDGIGQKMGINANITELLTSKTALMTAGIGAATAVIGKATQEWAKYNAELAKQDQITTVTTGLKGAGADRMTDQARALVDTYNVDFREAINAANTLMTQFGKSGEESMSLIRDGMRGMISGDGGKLLSMIQQYAPSFRDAGIEAAQLVAIIHNSEGGIFTDQNMNAIVMGIKNIRLMTDATSKALAKLGIDGEEMTRKLNDGSMTIFEAMQKVSTAINGAGSASQAAGEVMQQVFGRQGAAAGTKLGEAIATLNTNLEETKRQTGELGDAYDDLYEANVKLNGAIRDCFEYDGWDQMATGIKSKLVSALASVLDYLGKIKGFLFGFSVKQYQGDEKKGGGAFIDRAIARLGDGKSQGQKTIYQKQIDAYANQIFNIGDKIRKTESDIKVISSNRTANISDGGAVARAISTMKSNIAELEKEKEAIKRNMDEYDRRAQAVFAGAVTPPQINSDINSNTGGGNTNGGKTTSSSSPTYAEDSIAAQSALVSELTKKWNEAGETMRSSYLYELIQAENKLKDMKDEQSGLRNQEQARLDLKSVQVDAPNISDSLMPTIESIQQQLDANPLVIHVETVDKDIKAIAKSAQITSQMVGTIGQAFNAIEDPASKVAGTIAMSIANIAMAYSQALANDPTLKTSIYGLIAAAAASTISMATTIASLHSSTGYAQGGMVKGNSYSGDNIAGLVDGSQLVGLNAGEIVLNQAGQRNVAAGLQGGVGGNLNLHGVIKGEDILITADRSARRQGKGELVFWR